MTSTAKGAWTGIYRRGSGHLAVVSAGHGWPARTQFFPKGTPLPVMQDWRKDMQATVRLERSQRAYKGGFAGDAKRYLQAVKALPSYRERARDIDRWIQVFGHRRRATITSADIRTWRDRWMTEPRGKDQPPYAASTINHRLRALSNLWTVLDGKRAPNPVREVPEVPEPDAEPRALSYSLIEAILTAMPDRGQPEKGKPNRAPSLAKARLRVMAYTGLTYSELGRLRPTDVNLSQATMLVGRRRKGKGTRATVLPLLPEAVDAFRALDAARGWGPFSGPSVRKSFLVAVKKVRKTREDVPESIRVHDLRHSMGTLVFRATGSREIARDLLRHATTRTTERYTLAAIADVLAAQLAKVKA